VDLDQYGQTITNTVSYAAAYDGSGSATAAFTVILEPVVSIAKEVEVPEILNPGETITYTLGLSNTSGSPALNVQMTDTLPVGVTFGGWVLQNGADETGGVITWGGDLNEALTFIFTVTVDYDPSFYGQTVINTVLFTSDNAGSGTASAEFTVETPELSIVKTVETANDPALPGDPLTYTVVVRNEGTTGAVDVHILDTLPAYVIGSGVDTTVSIDAGAAYTITIPATLAFNVPIGSTIINTASYTSGTLTGEASVSFSVIGVNRVYLPFVWKN